MWPMLIGLAFGVIVYFLGAWIGGQFGPLYRFMTEDGTATWLRALLVILVVATSAVWLGALFLVIHGWPPLSATFESRGGWGLFWPLFYGSKLPSACLGFALGLLATAWGAYAASPSPENAGLTGIALAVFATLTLIFGVDRDLNFLGRLSKVSASVFSFEFESARNSANKGAKQVTASSIGSQATAWSSSEAVNLALQGLKDLSDDAIRRDNAAAVFISNKGKSPAEGSAEPGLPKQMTASAEFLRKAARQFVALREAIHLFDRDANPAFFYTEKLELIRFAVGLRDLVLLDLRTTANNALRANQASEAMSALGDLISHSKKRVCTFELWKQAPLSPSQAANIEREARCNERDIDADHLMPLLPDRETVRKTPYVAIVAALFLLGGGERESAAAILDQWRHQAQATRIAAIASTTAGEYERSLAAVHDVRVVNLMGRVLADETNAVLLELAATYQWSAMKQSDAIIDAHPKLRHFSDKMQSGKTGPTLVAIAGDMSSGLSPACDDTSEVPPDVAYFVYRRASELNTTVFYLTMLPGLLELPEMSEKLDALMALLNGVRIDCLLKAVNVSEIQAKASVASFVDTLAHGFLVQATLRKGDASRASKALCKAYVAATRANALAGPTRGTPFSNHEQFLDSSLRENSVSITNYRFKTVAADNLRSTRDQVEALGEGACGSLLAKIPASSTADGD